MQRILNWHNALNAHIRANMDEPFAWGKNDCALWAASAIAVISGDDFAAKFRGTYKSELGAVRVLKKLGITTPEELADKYLGERKHINYAASGDIVAADLEKLGYTGGEQQIGLSLGVCNGPVSYFVTDAGLVALRTRSLEWCWHG